MHKKVFRKIKTSQIRFVSINKHILKKKHFDLDMKYFYIQLEEIHMGNVLLDYLF